MTKQAFDRIRLLTAEGIDLIRIGLHSLFENHATIQLIGIVDSIEDLYKLASQQNPDVLLVDLHLNAGGANHIAEVLAISPRSKVLAFSQQKDTDIYLKTFRSGAAGIINKNCPADLIIKAIHAIHAGQIWFDRNLTKLLWEAQFNPKTPKTTSAVPSPDSVITLSSNLSHSERQIAYLASKGFSAKETSSLLLITEKTVRNQLSIIYKKLGVKNQIELCLKAPSYDYFQSSHFDGTFVPKK